MTLFGKLSEEDADYCLQQLRLQARDLYLASLLLPSKTRSAVTVLHAFHAEISGITLAAPEPLAGEIRLQWWSDVLLRKRDAEAAQNPLARALLAVTASHHLPTRPFVEKLEAHIFDLYNDAMGDTSALEAYLGETRSAMCQLAVLASHAHHGPGASDASGHAGVAIGCVALLENLARHRVQGRIYFPSDLLSSCGTDAHGILTQSTDAQAKAVLALCDLAQQHHRAATAALRGVPEEIKPIFAPLALVPLYLQRIRKHPLRALTGLPPVAQWRVQWALWRG